MSKLDAAVSKFEQGMSRAPDWLQEFYGESTVWELMASNGLQALGIGLAGWLLASWMERRHLKSLDQCEIPLQHIVVNTFKHAPPCEAESSTLLIGSIVIAHDYFRTLIILLRKMIGGNIRPYERLVCRGRRAALIRLKEEAELRGLDKVINLRFTTTMVSGRFLHAIEMVAYGTGIRTGSIVTESDKNQTMEESNHF